MLACFLQSRFEYFHLRSTLRTYPTLSYGTKKKNFDSQASDHVWFFLTYSQGVRAKKRRKKSMFNQHLGLSLLGLQLPIQWMRICVEW